MKKIYIAEQQIGSLCEKKITFYDFLQTIKDFLKQLLTLPSAATLDNSLIAISMHKNDVINDLITFGIIRKFDDIREVPTANGGKIAKRYISYKVIKRNIIEKIKALYKDYLSRRMFLEEDGGATSCGSAMQGGGVNPSSGQYEMPFIGVQHKEFWKPTIVKKPNIKSKKK